MVDRAPRRRHVSAQVTQVTPAPAVAIRLRAGPPAWDHAGPGLEPPSRCATAGVAAAGAGRGRLASASGCSSSSATPPPSRGTDAGAAAAVRADEPPDLTPLASPRRCRAWRARASAGVVTRIHRRGKFHKGTDFRADRGTPVFAAGAGRDRLHRPPERLRQRHLCRSRRRRGDALRPPAPHRGPRRRWRSTPGVRIGQVGATGRATGPAPALRGAASMAARSIRALAMQVASLQRTDPLAGAARRARPGAGGAERESVDRHDPVRPRTASRRSPTRAPPRADPQPLAVVSARPRVCRSGGGGPGLRLA